ncbi:MAG: hypothetical protein ACE5KZ_09875 [Candidatus Scalinduaceae bacterium]
MSFPYVVGNFAIEGAQSEGQAESHPDLDLESSLALCHSHESGNLEPIDSRLHGNDNLNACAGITK